MIIGVDFDNTIVSYDELFYHQAFIQKLIPKNLASDKEAIRDYLRQQGKEKEWVNLQGEVYGPLIREAQAFPGVKEFFILCIKQKIPLYIISHKTKQPASGKQYDLHQAAMNWLVQNGFFTTLGLTKDSVFFETTQNMKEERILKQECTHFIDDLPEFLCQPSFPNKVERILFDPNQRYADEKGIHRFTHWEAMQYHLIPDNDLKKKINSLLSQSQLPNMKKVQPIQGGRNNKAYCVEVNDNQKYLLKSYYYQEGMRDRLASEYDFLTYAWTEGIRNIPQPLAQNEEHKLGLYTFIDGKKPELKNITEKAIHQLITFWQALNQHKEKAKNIINSSDCAFSIQENIASVQQRMDKLSTIDKTANIHQDVAEFYTQELLPAWERVQKHVKKKAAQLHLSTNEKTPQKDRFISPSDFGFHNTLLDGKGTFHFIDFEYAGWDDPAKMVCDIFCQPELPIAAKYFDTVMKYVVAMTSQPQKYLALANIIYPICRIKFCCIILNEFIEEGFKRRQFSQSMHSKRKQEQLALAKKYISTLTITGEDL